MQYDRADLERMLATVIAYERLVDGYVLWFQRTLLVIAGVSMILMGFASNPLPGVPTLVLVALLSFWNQRGVHDQTRCTRARLALDWALRGEDFHYADVQPFFDHLAQTPRWFRVRLERAMEHTAGSVGRVTR